MSQESIDDMSREITEEEIREVMWSLPYNKAPAHEDGEVYQALLACSFSLVSRSSELSFEGWVVWISGVAGGNTFAAMIFFLGKVLLVVRDVIGLAFFCYARFFSVLLGGPSAVLVGRCYAFWCLFLAPLLLVQRPDAVLLVVAVLLKCSYGF
ncbi:hypothetical protein U1Q18_032690 [Sarracenia purpurea var. burkii]